MPIPILIQFVECASRVRYAITLFLFVARLLSLGYGGAFVTILKTFAVAARFTHILITAFFGIHVFSPCCNGTAR